MKLLPLVVLPLLFAACQQRRTEEQPSLVVGRAADAIGLDPARVNDAESVEVCEQIYEHLVRLRNDSPVPEPALARSWEHAGDGKVWTFHLRSGVRFHDGTPFDADAVIFSFERQRDEHHPFHYADFTYETLFHDIASLEKLDALTVRIVLRQPYAPFLGNLAMFPMSIVSPQAVRRWGADFRAHPVGTGPFRFVEWSHGDRITLEANTDYWNGAPALKHLAFVPVDDPRQRLVKLEGGAIDVAENLAPQDLQFVALHPALGSVRVAAQNLAYLAMNTRRPPFDDARVRRAVALAIDREAIVKFIYQGLATVATGPLAPSMWGALSLAPAAADPAAARALLQAAGYQAGERPLQLHVSSTPRLYMPAPVHVARMIAQNLRDVGIEVELAVHEIDEQLRVTARGEHDLCLLGWTADNGDPDNVFYTLFHSSNAEPGLATNLSFIAEPELDDLLDRAQVSLDRGQREHFYQRVQHIVAQRAPIVPLAHSNLVVAHRFGVHGLVLPPTATLNFQGVTLERP